MEDDTDSQTVGLIINLVIGIPTLILCFLLFDILRKRVPAVFEARRALNHRRNPLDYHGRRVYTPPPPSYRLFGWVGPVLRLELDTIAETHGLDTALFLKYLRAMAALFLCLCIASAGLLPVFFTASNKDLPLGDSLRTKGINRFSIANLPEDDPWRFWVILLVEYVLTGLVCFYLSGQFALYSKDRRHYRAAKSPQNYTVLVQDIPPHSCSEEAVQYYWDRLFPGLVERVYIVHDARKLLVKKGKFWNAVTKRERAEWDMEFNDKLAGARPTHKVGTCACCRGASVRVDSIQYWAEQQHHYSSKIALNQQEVKNSGHSPLAGAAIVTFKTRRAAAVAAQTNFGSKESEWRVARAPEPNAVNWNSLGIGKKLLPVRNGFTLVASMALTLFWLIPVTMIMGLANLSALADITIRDQQPFSFLDNVANWSPVLKSLIESLLPVIILSVFLSLIPTFFRMFVSVSRVASTAKTDNIVRDWYFIFVIFSNFLFVALAGTLLNDLQRIISDPGSTIDLLATAVPKQAAFIMNFILLKALSETPQQLLQIVRVVLRWVILRFFAATPRERNTVDTGNTVFVYLRYYAMSQLVALLGLIYSTIQPFIIPVCFAYFAINYIVYKYNLCYSLHNPYQDGGSMYGGALYGLWVGLLLHLLTIIGLFGLNKKPAQSALAVVPVIFAVLFLRQYRKSYDRIVEHGSALETQVQVEEEDGEDMIPEDLATKYIHPGFEPLPDPIPNLNGVDGNTGDVKYSDVEDLENSISGMERVDDKDGDNLKLPNTPSTEEWKDAHGQQVPNETV